MNDLIEGSKSMKTVTRLIHASLLIAGVFSTSVAIACTTDLWNGGTEGSPVAGSPANVSRVSGLCAMELTAAGSVKDTSPTAEPTAYMRFYVYAQLDSGTPVIFEAFSDDNATSSLLTVSFDGSNFLFNAGDNTSTSAPVPGKSGWNLVELAWTGGDVMEYWVNTDASQTGSLGFVAAIAGTMESVILGTSSSYEGTLTFDDYESHRSTPVGEVLAGDGNSDSAVNSGDINVIVNEFLFNTLGTGTPDCNLDGAVNSGDINCVVAIFLNL